jgi:hypothetical protein
MTVAGESQSIEPSAKMFAFSVMIEGAKTALTLSGLVFTALLAFYGATFQGASEEKSFSLLLFAACFCLISSATISMHVIYTGVDMADNGIINVRDKKIEGSNGRLLIFLFLGLLFSAVFLVFDGA